jgi:hypothetical protein
MSAFADIVVEQMRRDILRLLAAQPNYAANNVVLGLALERVHALRVTADQIRAELAWLAQLRLVSLIALNNTTSMVALTERGSDVAKGLSTIPGIAALVPGDGT